VSSHEVTGLWRTRMKYYTVFYLARVHPYYLAKIFTTYPEAKAFADTMATRDSHIHYPLEN